MTRPTITEYLPLHPVKFEVWGVQAFGRERVFIEEAKQRDGSMKYKIVNEFGGSCLTKEGLWEIELLPSSRTDDYLKRARYKTIDKALMWLHRHLRTGTEVCRILL